MWLQPTPSVVMLCFFLLHLMDGFKPVHFMLVLFDTWYQRNLLCGFIHFAPTTACCITMRPLDLVGSSWMDVTSCLSYLCDLIYVRAEFSSLWTFLTFLLWLFDGFTVVLDLCSGVKLFDVDTCLLKLLLVFCLTILIIAWCWGDF